MELSVLLQLYAWNCYGSLAIGLALNFLLLFVAKKCSSSGLREYRRVVFYFCAQNIAMLILQALTQPLFFSGTINYMWMFVAGPITQIPSPSLWRISNILYLILVYQSMAGLAMQFVGRYLVICKNHQNKICQNLMLGSFIALLDGLIIGCEILAIPDKSNLELEDLNEPLLTVAKNLSKNIKIVSQYDMDNPIIRAYFFGLFGFMIFSYLAMIICYRRIKAFLKANMQTDVVHGVKRKTFNTIIRSMWIQAIVPFYSLGLVTFVLGVLAFVDFELNMEKYLLLVLYGPINWLPVLNPLVTILTIENYRLGVLGIFKGQQQIQTTPVPFFVKSQTRIIK